MRYPFFFFLTQLIFMTKLEKMNSKKNLVITTKRYPTFKASRTTPVALSFGTCHIPKPTNGIESPVGFNLIVGFSLGFIFVSKRKKNKTNNKLTAIVL